MNKNELLNLATETLDFNSNNGWGFGGAIGTRYFFENGSRLTIAKACYRHAPSHKFHRLIDPEGNDVFDVERMSQKHLTLLKETIEDQS